MPIPTHAVWAVGEKTGGALAAIACCSGAAPARLTDSPSESICRLLQDLRMHSSSATPYFASAVHCSQARSRSNLQANRPHNTPTDLKHFRRFATAATVL